MGHTHGDTQENYFKFLSMTIKKKFECFFSPQISRVRYRFGFVFLSLQYRYPDSMINEKFILIIIHVLKSLQQIMQKKVKI